MLQIELIYVLPYILFYIPKIVLTDLLLVTQCLETIGIPRPSAQRSFSVLRTLSVTSTVG